jgi:hypothetical protein
MAYCLSDMTHPAFMAARYSVKKLGPDLSGFEDLLVDMFD